MAELVIEKLTKRFGDNLVVDNINFTVPSEKFVTILGPSGCGKTTVLRCIVGVERPDGGKMKLGDEVLFSKKENLFIPTEKRGMGMVYQSYALWPHMTVFENVAYPLQVRKMEKDEISEQIMFSIMYGKISMESGCYCTNNMMPKLCRKRSNTHTPTFYNKLSRAKTRHARGTHTLTQVTFARITAKS